MKDVYSFDEVMERLGVTREALLEMVEDGELRAFRDENSMKFKKEDVDQLAEAYARNSLPGVKTEVIPSLPQDPLPTKPSSDEPVVFQPEEETNHADSSEEIESSGTDDASKVGLFLEALSMTCGLAEFYQRLGKSSAHITEHEILLDIRNTLPEIAKVIPRLNNEELLSTCKFYGLTTDCSREEQVAKLISFLHLRSIVDLEGYLRSEIDPTHINYEFERPATRAVVMDILDKMIIPRAKNEPAAQTSIFERLRSAYPKKGPGKVMIGPELAVGEYNLSRVDIDVNKKIGIEIKLARSLFGHRFSKKKKSAQEIKRMLGQLFMYTQKYKRRGLILAIVGDVSDADEAALVEIQNVVNSQDIGFVRIAERLSG